MSQDDNYFVIESTEQKKIDVNDLKIGMFVSALDRPWLQTNFLFQGFELKTPEDIEAVQQQCEYVYIDTTKETKVERFNKFNTAYSLDYLEKAIPPKPRTDIKHEIKSAVTVHRKTSNLVKTFMEEVKFGKPINAMAAKVVVNNCVESILNSHNALMLLTQLKKRDEYTAQHSMNVCIFSIALGRQINLSTPELNKVGLCGLMHDMGKMLIPNEILNKPGRFTAEELEIMKQHTSKGYRLLLNTADMLGSAIDVAHMHHERLDGKGYPRQLTAERISHYAKIVAITDMYDAITSDRVYQNGRSHLDAIKLLTESSMNGHLDSGLTMKFIECLGIYPVGSVVELTSGETGLVIEIHAKAKLKPKILMLKDQNNKTCNPFVIDLSLDSYRQYGIKKILRAEECDIDLVRHYQNGLLERSISTA